jgi:hypothetical protein
MVVQNKIFNYYFGGLKFLGSIKFLKTSTKKKKNLKTELKMFSSFLCQSVPRLVPGSCQWDFPWTASMNFIALVYWDWTILDCHFNMELHLHFGSWHFPCTSHIETAVVPNNLQTRPAFWFWDFPFTSVGSFNFPQQKALDYINFLNLNTTL